MTYLSIVTKLIGDVYPVGCASRDELSLQNLKQLCTLTEELALMIQDVSERYEESREFSVKNHSEYAKKFLKDLKEII